MPELHVRSGAVIALRLFDIAYSIDLKMVEQLWAARGAAGAATRSRLSATPTKAVAFDVPPVQLSLDPVEIAIGEEDVPVSVSARLYDFGVVALAIRAPAKALSWQEFRELFNSVDRSVGPKADSGLWAHILEKLRTSIEPAMIRPTTTVLEEDYLIAVVQQLSEKVKASELLEEVDLVPLLAGEERPLSEAARRDVLKHRFSYYEDDLVVLTWDRAFIYEPRSDSDVADILEVANAQLLELRYYDELLDDELPLMYDLVEETRRTTDMLAPHRFAKLARKLYTLVAEVTELTEKAENTLQVTEDVYLARIYMSALEVFRVKSVSAAVDRKLAIVRDTYAALYSEASGARGTILEIAVVLLIVIEIVVALLRHV